MSRTRVRFGDVVRKVNKKVDPIASGIERYVAGEHMDTDEARIHRFGIVGDGYLGPAFHMLFEPGHILYGSRRTYLRKVAMPDFSGVCANTTFVLEPSTEDLDRRYLLYVMSTERFHQNSISLSKGSTNPYINFSDLASYEFELPSLDEQARLVELLMVLDGHHEALQQVHYALCNTRKVLLAELFSEIYPVFLLPELCEIYQPMTISTSVMSDEFEYPVFGAAGIIGRYSTFNHQLSEVVITCRGATCGAIHVTPPNCWITGNAMVVSPKDDRISKDFLLLALEATQESIRRVITGSAQPQITRRSLESIKVPIPSVAEQESLLRRVQVVDRALACAADSRNVIRNLRSSVVNSELS